MIDARVEKKGAASLVFLRARVNYSVGRRRRRPTTTADEGDPFIVATCSASLNATLAFSARQAAEHTLHLPAHIRLTNWRLEQ